MERDISFGSIVKEHRQVLDLTQAELARRVACATITIRKIESDSLRPSIQIAERLATSLKIPLEDRAAFVRLARTASPKTPTPQPLPSPPPTPEEIGLEDLSGRAIRGYELGDRMGEGGFGVVYRAIQPLVEREVAVKIILPRYADHPEFIRRFEAEAQLVARLEHPHIVPLYDYWREPGAAFLVMRLMRGGSLHSRLKEGPLSLDFILRMLNQVGAALFAAHRMGVIHRDLKPANILLDEDENSYLADFGVAKNLASPEQTSDTLLAGIIGSPAYVSPEQIRAEPIQPQADIYALGVLLFQLLTGQLPFQGPTPIDYVQQHLNQPTPPLLEYNPHLPPKLEPVLSRATAKTPTERYPDVPSLVSDFHSAVASAGVEIPPSATLEWLPADQLDAEEIENPYKGLRAFEEADAEDFFGRETLIQDLLGRMAEENDLSRFLAVVGPSGSGKSSAVKAGLIPSLRRGGLPGSENWFIVEFTPGSHPFEELETALLRVAVNPPESLLGQLCQDERGLLRAVGRILPPDKTVDLLLVVDQFEELFTLLEDEDTRAAFLESLLTAILDPRSRLRVVITLRADFTDRPLEYVDFGELLRQRTEFVLPLTPDELEQAITQPARGAGLALESGLSERIIRDLGDQPGALPLLQYALTELFERRVGRRLTLDAYQDSGGVLGALGKRAEEIYSGLEPETQGTARQVFLRLVTLGEGVEDTRRRVSRSELEMLGAMENGPFSTALDTVLDQFGHARLLSFDRDPLTRQPTVEVAHEALLREWSRLREWLDQSRADIRTQRVLGNAAAEWLEADRDPSFLLRGSRLDQFEAWAETTDLALTQVEGDYLEASLAERRAREAAEAERLAREAALERRSRNFLRGLVGVFALAAVIAVALSIFAFQQRQTAQRQAGTLLASQAESELEDGNTDQAILLALEALENYPYTAQAEHALGQAVTNNRALQLYEGHTAAVTGAAWSSDGKRIATSSNDNTVHIWDSNTGDLISQINLPAGITGNIYDWAQAVQWSLDDQYLLTIAGDRFVTGSQDYDLLLWDVETGEQIAARELQNSAPPSTGELGTTGQLHYLTGAGAAFAQDGRLATLGGNNTALVWGPMLEDQQLVLNGHTAGVNAVAWSPDFTRLATASEDGTARIWDADSGQELIQLAGHSAGVNQVAWSPDGSRIATSGKDAMIWFWDGTSGEKLTSIQIADFSDSIIASELMVWSLAWSPDGNTLAAGSGDGYIRLWDVGSGEQIIEMKGHDQFVTFVAWSPQDDRLVSAGADGKARVWKITRDNMLLSLPYETVTYGAWSPDGRNFAVGTGGDSENPSYPHQGLVAVWDFKTGKPVFETLGNKDGTGYWQNIVYTPNGKHLTARAGKDWPDTTDGNKIYLLDSQTGEIVRTFDSGKATQLLLSDISPDGQLVGAGDYEGTIYIWETSSGQLLRTLNCLAWAHQVEWSPDGSKIAVLCIDWEAGVNAIQVFDAETYEPLLTIEEDILSANINLIKWSPDSKRIAAGCGNDEIGSLTNSLYIYDASSGEELLNIVGQAGMIAAFDWSPDGKRLVSGSTDDTTRIWDAQTGAELLTLSTPNDFVLYPYWSPDGKYLLTTIFNIIDTSSLGRSGVWRVWQTTEELIEYAKACCVFRELTSEERQQFGLPPS